MRGREGGCWIQSLCVKLILGSIFKAGLLKAIHSRSRHDVEFFYFSTA